MGYIPTMFHGPATKPTSVTFYVGSRPYMADESVPQFAELLAELKKPDPDTARLIALTEPAQAIAQAVAKVEAQDYLPKGVVSVTRSQVIYNGKPVNGVLVDRILGQLASGFNFMPTVKFMENLFTNPAEYAHDELYLWLEKSDLPITEDGCFLAYKRVRSDFGSFHDNGKTSNKPGTTVQIPRENVDTVRAHTCSTGLHFCSKKYLVNGPGGFGGGYSGSSDSKVVILKINPADVVSIPDDYDNSKGRAWKYDVLAEVTKDEFDGKWAAVVTATGGVAALPPVQAPAPTPVLRDVLRFPSDLSRSLYAALGEINLAGSSHQQDVKRHNWASAQLRRTVTSFYDLTVTEASTLIRTAKALKAELDRVTSQKANAKAVEAVRAQTEAINSYGIETLRAKASEAGLNGAWKGFKSADLKAYLISNL